MLAIWEMVACCMQLKGPLQDPRPGLSQFTTHRLGVSSAGASMRRATRRLLPRRHARLDHEGMAWGSAAYPLAVLGLVACHSMASFSHFRAEDGQMDCYPAVATKLRECSRIHRTDQHTADASRWPVRTGGPVNAMAW